MMIRNLFLITCFLLVSVVSTKAQSMDHNLWTSFLQKHVSITGQVDYKNILADDTELKAYIQQLNNNTPNKNWSKNETLAYWINAYNALTIDLILRNYPVKSIKDIKDPWDQKYYSFNGQMLSLNQIEHDILRKMDEPRIHFAIVCASESCPKLLNEAYVTNKLEEQLTNATKTFVNDNSKNIIRSNQLELSKIFKWFTKDFKQQGSLIDFLNQYSAVPISDDAKISYLEYNWDLND
ncbi:DUF547 domain-containing protein [Hanstruepera neustonica]|uniref:DUF547 domain-containing protein n=2 Tax=Hanstruepera neustonica TaxID=1445657 RepID=A0A2K1E596_9FLAO|nr:DUF547 domain-containing protein [Hanstruepera neustonica]